MCIAVFAWKIHPIHPLILLLNRDEYYNRPTTPLGWWPDGLILGGRDEQAGGTWMACSRDGKLAFLTNVREALSRSQLKSRGDLPVRFFTSGKSPKEFGEEVLEEADEFNGFNLIVADLCSMSMVYITNRPMDGGLSMEEVSPGIHVLSNAKLDTPWPKAQRVRRCFEDVLGKYSEAEISLKEITKMVMNDTTKDDSDLPGIYSREFEYLTSSIFVEADTASGRYGTRSTSAVVLRTDGAVSFYETYLENDAWRDHTINFSIQTDKTAP
ncbi:transport and Golgi organization 2 homolog [Salvia hispanica]|uniref:transport and Golgi organization 2 homolog n=1 Tax=Salvia hispanica TaxID=49212 RepID=UPI002009A3D1|nr:transport and Golgi organization 2 homolog [Salvia hispanica]